MLNPNARSLYTSSLMPPPGFIFDRAIATTFSMDPTFLLQAPVYLAMFATDSGGEPDPLAVLEGIRRYSRRITVYGQRGRIHAPRLHKPNPLFGLLEEMVTEVTAPRGGVFHPKIWAIRFVRADLSEPMYRLVVLTRNMTADQSWDLSLQLEGMVGRGKLKQNRPLAVFLRLLPDLRVGQSQPERDVTARLFADELYTVRWELPAGFDELKFYLPGRTGFEWNSPDADRIAVISPFCSDESLCELVSNSSAVDALVSRPESLSSLSPETRARFSRCLHLDEAAETEEGEEGTDQISAHGLHAKVYLFETFHYSAYTHVVMGSANATNAALLTGKNVEFLVELVGKKRSVGGIDELLNADGLGEYLEDFRAAAAPEVDTERAEAEKILERAWTALTESSLSVECGPESVDGKRVLLLQGEIPRLPATVHASAWPITVQPDNAASLTDGIAPEGVVLGEFSPALVTGLIAFELRTQYADVTAKFVLNLPLKDAPDDRFSAILQTVIRNRDGFMRYLLLLLSEGDSAGVGSDNGSGWASWLARLADDEDLALLEELIRAYSRHPEKLSEIASLVEDVSRKDDQRIIPEDFLDLWKVFEVAIGDHDV
jgi:hypothetical protein